MFPPKRQTTGYHHNLRIEDPSKAWEAYFKNRVWIDNGQISCYQGGADWEQSDAPLLVCFHGAGHTGLSFALVTKFLGTTYKVAAVDMRAHGWSKGSVEELTIDTLVDDGVRIVKDLLKLAKCDRGYVLCGHSMGASVVARVGNRVDGLLAVVLLDAAEGSAIEALPAIESGFLARLPKYGFCSLEEAVEWALGSAVLRNKESAVLSIPSQLKKFENKWIWRVDLGATRMHWESWFLGMNNEFLGCNSGRVLVMAGTSARLDKQLTVAMMQGKFHFISVKKTGHILQEDQPEEVARILVEVARRPRTQVVSH